ncbi:MAG: hypothetical protein J2P16_01175, partial [Mycobacterium sp.]|nr:hypothetical protein [Mycobacterium sp.]
MATPPVPLRIRRTALANTPPPALAEGQLAVGMADTPPSLWVGVPSAIDPTQRRQINPPPTPPTVQRFITGSGTYTPTAGTAWIRVRMCGGGGGGGGTTNSGGPGTTTSFGGWTAIRGLNG